MSEIVRVELINGYVFRMLIDIYGKLGIVAIPIYFKKDCIEIYATGNMRSGERDIICAAHIDAEEIPDYYFDTKHANLKDADDPAYLIPIETDRFVKILKNFQKSNMLKLSIDTKNKNLCVSHESYRNEIPPIQISNHQDIEDFNIPDRPSVRIDITKFTGAMKNISSSFKSGEIHFEVFDNGLLIKNSNGSTEFGYIPEDAVGYITNVSVKFARVFKLGSGVKGSVIKVYSSDNGILCLSHKIDTIGEHKIFLLS